ncbi:MAG TPA: arginine deiminase-related protein [Streptosporangiaceae bacterium]|nr:arginine deiminase-related protein [Streptosporangiaceae bacterium]
MTQTSGQGRHRAARTRTYLMCPPEYFTVEYTINPWMNPDRPADAALALRQWQCLRDVFLRLGHTVHTIDPLPGLPDMVFAANGATVIDGQVLGSRFRYPQREAEGPAYLGWFAESGYPTTAPRLVNEGQGDIVFDGHTILAGHGFRTNPDVAEELGALYGLPVLSLRLVDPRFYHLDTALCVLDADTAAYYPAAFDDASRAALISHFSELVEAKDEDAEVLGLNAISDGRHVVLPEQAAGLTAQIADKGFVPVGIDMSEFLKAGGGPKCCTLEFHLSMSEPRPGTDASRSWT